MNIPVRTSPPSAALIEALEIPGATEELYVGLCEFIGQSDSSIVEAPHRNMRQHYSIRYSPNTRADALRLIKSLGAFRAILLGSP